MDNYLNKVISDRYEIQEVIGIGGMSIVYKAYDRVDDRIVAVKILKDEFMANEEFRLRFKNESKAISMLSHPNIVKVYDVSFGENLQYIVMEYVEGITLKEYIERQKVLDPREAEHFVIQILRALQHAHDKGIVHRDIKPQNIILLPNANIKVTDFGIARFNHMEARNVNESSAIGSVHYVSPEQARGDYTDGRSDIYSVGVVLYEMLTGKVPFEADNDTSVALMQLQEQAQRPSLLNPSIPIGLEQITMHALQKDPTDRYQSAAEFLSDLYDFKRNPQIKFDYSYVRESEPTKPIITGAPVLSTADIPVKIKEEDYTETIDEEEEETERNVTVPILVGIAIALIIVIGIIVAVAFGDSFGHPNPGESSSVSQDSDSFWKKLDLFGWFSSDKIEIPNFLNMDFEEAREKFPDLAIDPNPKYVYNTTYEPGKVIEQFPEAGAKVSPDTVITLHVAMNSDMVQVPDVRDYNYTEAEGILTAKGFHVELFQAYANDATEDAVIYTDPKHESYAAYGSTVYVYYSTANSSSMNTTRVPNIVGDQESVARQKIIAAGLKIGAVTSDESTAALKGYVIGQNPINGATVPTGTVINMVVGNGVQGSSTATFQITLPSLSAKKATVRTYLNGAVYDTFSKVSLDGSALTVSFTGEGEENEFTVYIDSTKYMTGQIDFTKSKDKVSNVFTYSVHARDSLPNVVGMTLNEARSALKAAGFTNISVKSADDPDVAKGKVISQSPVSSKLTQYSTGIEVTLIISTGKGEKPTEEPTTEEPTDPPTTEPTTAEPITEEPTSATEPSTKKPPETKPTETPTEDQASEKESESASAAASEAAEEAASVAESEAVSEAKAQEASAAESAAASEAASEAAANSASDQERQQDITKKDKNP